MQTVRLKYTQVKSFSSTEDLNEFLKVIGGRLIKIKHTRYLYLVEYFEYYDNKSN